MLYVNHGIYIYVQNIMRSLIFCIFSEASYSQLTEITNQIIEWERKLINYDSEHKTDIFHDFQDFKTKLLIKLDRIDVSTILKIETDRSKLYDRLEILTKNFHNKIHEGHSDCSHCVQVKEVTINL